MSKAVKLWRALGTKCLNKGVNNKMKFEHIYNTFKARLPATLTLKPCLFKPLRAAIQTMNTTFRFRAVRPAPPTYSHLKMICSVPGYEFKPVINRGEGCRSCALMRIWHDFRHVDKCIFCNKYADRHGEQLKGKCKVRGHCLLTGADHGAAHKHVTFTTTSDMKIPVLSAIT